MIMGNMGTRAKAPKLGGGMVDGIFVQITSYVTQILRYGYGYAIWRYSDTTFFPKTPIRGYTNI